MAKKNPHAVALGKLGGAKGGRARAENLSAEELSEIGRKGGEVGGQRRAEALTEKQRKEIAKKAAAKRWAGHEAKHPAAGVDRNLTRVQWQETRDGELWSIGADKRADGAWEFFERSSMEIAWHPCAATPERLRWVTQQVAKKVSRRPTAKPSPGHEAKRPVTKRRSKSKSQT